MSVHQWRCREAMVSDTLPYLMLEKTEMRVNEDTNVLIRKGLRTGKCHASTLGD